MKKYFLLLITPLLFSCGYGVNSNEVKTTLNNYILRTENIIVDGDHPIISKHPDKDSVKVAYLYETHGINKGNDSVQKFSKRFFAFNKLDLSFRELKSNREDIEFIHYRDLKAKQAREDSIIAIEQNKVIGDIFFGTSLEEYKKKKKLFIKKTKNTGRGSNGLHKQNIGDYEFNDIYGGFHNEKLYRIDVLGNGIHYDNYNIEMPKQVEAIKLPYIEKYGKPNIYNEIPKWHRINKGYTYLISSWTVGSKKIELRIEPDGNYNRLLVKIFQPTIANQIKQDEEIKRNEEIKKAKNLL
ncbi:hypothetical protein CXF68_09125 [Tenacibaculum sp. Bg11-29]|uniref:hypothetical protein n=1 Tax=Tenacibaculum sp. Bg11-29 TaxID=2058306 RepID=UPI000C340F3C|nr:hypothetical protein [Tenacibaculum sp. Bg11-29]PKH50837.1 hypothetical protein CXF68_09125 [Tenacibaculum sp. Bg11-29]